MPSAIPEYTPYPYVNEAVRYFLEKVQTVLGRFFYGLYLHGSLAGGDFEPGRSDIDFLVVTNRELPDDIIPALKDMHKRVWENGPAWARKLEGTYIPVKALYRYNPSDPPRPHVLADKFMMLPNEPYWVIERYILRKGGIVISGPPVKPLIAPISPEEIRHAVIMGTNEAWPERTHDGKWLIPEGYQPYIVLTCCRALYTLKYGVVKSKTVSSRWALKALGKRWIELIENAIVWRHGMPHGDIAETLEMMKYTLERIKAYQARRPDSL
jgi:hypothetical protein